MAIKVTDWPYMKPQARSKLHRELNRAANPRIIEPEARPLSMEDLFNAMSSFNG